MGQNLASKLSTAIQQMTARGRAGDNDDLSRADLVGELAQQAGIETGTVNQILNGEINCPPQGRLEAFAEVLGVSTDFLVSAAEEDGCSYGG